jgi:hypothetical protein
MKRPGHILLFFVAALLACSCETGYIERDVLASEYIQMTITFNVTPTRIDISADAKTQEISIELTGNIFWSASTNDSWIWLTESYGTGTSKTTVNIASNQSSEPRTGRIEISANNITRTITIYQEGQ